MAGIVIIGAGECGVRAAFALREQGYQLPVTLIGDEAELPYERPPLSKEMGDLKSIRPLSAYKDAGIECCFGSKVSSISPDTKTIALATGKEVAYDKLLIATGAKPRLLSGMEGCRTLRTAADAQAISASLKPDARIGIIGGGFIGLELAATARSTGVDVTVIEAGPRLLARAVPEDIAEIVAARHKSEGVLIDCGFNVERADVNHVTIAGRAEIGFDAVIAGVGALPNTELAEDAGLYVQNGIVVDKDFRTSDPNIFAAGDCCNLEWAGSRVRLESWKAAQDQGAHVAAAMMGRFEPYTKVPWFWSDQYDLTLQVAGLFDMSKPVVRRETPGDQCIVFQRDEMGRPKAAAGIGPGNSVSKDIRVFEKLIEKGGVVEADQLSDPTQNLKKLLRAA